MRNETALPNYKAENIVQNQKRLLISDLQDLDPDEPKDRRCGLVGSPFTVQPVQKGYVCRYIYF